MIQCYPARANFQSDATRLRVFTERIELVVGEWMQGKIVRDLDSARLSPLSLSVAQPSLEDVFVKLVGRSILEDENQLVQGRDPFVEGRR